MRSATEPLQATQGGHERPGNITGSTLRFTLTVTPCAAEVIGQTPAHHAGPPAAAGHAVPDARCCMRSASTKMLSAPTTLPDEFARQM
ncbi:hypothetical protein XFF6992_470052 [Xanthomonas citri pv. fuscans]|nr:hypothetical protein XFF6992_470052 [Xanthomonas citri pv. fuscans]SOO34907.1 hypothetical protein XFF6994_4720008 [Xanthomonas citri pv. fuscans]